MSKPKYNRVVLKLSGEALAGEQGFAINPTVTKSVAEQVKEIAELDVEVAVVVGGGNIWRGKIGSEMGMDGAGADYIGHVSDSYEFISSSRIAWRISEFKLVYKLQLRCVKLQNLTFVVKQFVT